MYHDDEAAYYDGILSSKQPLMKGNLNQPSMVKGKKHKHTVKKNKKGKKKKTKGHVSPR